MRSEREPERAIEAYGRGVRTALRNNATAYGFSITFSDGADLLPVVCAVATGARRYRLFWHQLRGVICASLSC